MNAQYVLAVVIVITIVFLETEKGSEPHWGLLSAQSHAEPRDGEVCGKPDPRIIHQDGSCSGASGLWALDGLRLAPAWRTVRGSGF